MMRYEFTYVYQSAGPGAYVVFERRSRGDKRWTVTLPLRDWRAAGSPRRIVVTAERASS